MLDTIETTEAIETTGTDIEVIMPVDVLTVFTTEGGLDPILDPVRQAAAAFMKVRDASTSSGRKKIASMARKIATFKGSIEEHGKALAAAQKEIPKKIDAARKAVRDELDALKEAVREPLTAWEAQEEARVARHTSAVTSLRQSAECTGCPADEIRARLAAAEATILNDSCEEFLAEYALAKDRAVTSLRAALATREKHDAEQAELARLRAEAAERAAREKEEQIRRDAEAKAQAEAQQAAAASVQRAEAVARDELAAAARREADLKAQAAAAERHAAETEARLKREADEKQRRVAAEIAAREADTKHRASVHRAALDALMEGGVPEDCAKAAITLIAKRQVPGITINY